MTAAGRPVRASVIIVTYNSLRYVKANIGSLMQTLPEDCEIIVIDNASHDGTAEMILRTFPTVKVLQNRENVGFARANNQAAVQASGEYLIFLNPDTSVNDGWFEPLVEPLRDRYSIAGALVGLTTPKIVMMDDPSVINTAGNDMHISGLTACRGYGKDASTATFESDTPVSAVSGACFAVPKEVWHELGGFDESLFMYLEDADLSLRAQLAGYACLYVAGSTVQHDYKNAFSPQKLFFLERNRLLMITKNFRPKTLLLLLPALLAVEVLTVSYAALQGLDALRSMCYAYADFIRYGLDTLSNRKQGSSANPSTYVVLLSRLSTRLPIMQVSSPRLERIIDLVLTPVFEASLSLARWLA